MTRQVGVGAPSDIESDSKKIVEELGVARECLQVLHGKPCFQGIEMQSIKIFTEEVSQANTCFSS